MNHDLTIFKNFQIRGEQKIQFRAGFFNLFNQAFANTNIGNDINLTLETVCRVTVPSLPNGAGGTATNVCDVHKAGSTTQATKSQGNFGTINLKRGHRVVTFVLKYYF